MALAADLVVFMGFALSLALTLALVWRGTRRIPPAAKLLISWRGGRARLPKAVLISLWIVASAVWSVFGIVVGTAFLSRSPGGGFGVLILAGLQPVIAAISIKAAGRRL